MVKYRVLPYRQGSKGAKALADALGGKVLKLVGSSWKAREGDVIVNWGNTSHSGWPGMRNLPEYIKEASNKLTFFKTVAESCSDVIPQFWTNKADIPADVYPIVCRTVLAGHSGVGIVIAGSVDELVDAPLYVRYMKKKDEYRVHCGNVGEHNGYPYSEGGDVPFVKVILVQRKARRQGAENPNWQVRNHDNGFIYQRNDVDPPAAVIEAAARTFSATSLDFGAVDVIYNAHTGRAYVLEINTAPGIEGSTVTDYANFFRV